MAPHPRKVRRWPNVAAHIGHTYAEQFGAPQTQGWS
jgi:hypothetical protein